MKKCEYHLENGRCQLSFPFSYGCVGEDKCDHYQLNAERLCPNCNKKGASWSGYGKHGGFKYTCWTCERTWTEQFTWTETPGVCLRCGRKYETPFPEVVIPDGRMEIASEEWCADCNRLAMTLVFREISAYRMKGVLFDPLKHSKREENTNGSRDNSPNQASA